MFHFIFYGLLILVIGVCYYFIRKTTKKLEKTEAENKLQNLGSTLEFFGFIRWFAMLVLSIWVIVGINKTLKANTEQKMDQLELSQVSEVIGVRNQQASELSIEFAGLLVEKYPEHEKEIFAKISPTEVEYFWINYPEIQASQGAQELVEQIGKLTSACYDNRIKLEDIYKRMRYRKTSPWILNVFVDDIQEVKIPEIQIPEVVQPKEVSDV